jgi:predicted nucleic acid-binding protein
MTYLLDTDWVISFLNGRPEAVELVRHLADDGIAISIITYGEVYEGLLGGPSTAERRAQFDEFVARVDVIAPDLDIASRYADVRLQLRQQGLLIPDNDMWIAATARAYDLTLVSRDDHFRRIPDLRLYSPT